MLQVPNRARACDLDLNEIYSLESFGEFKDFAFGLLEAGDLVSSHGMIGRAEDMGFVGSRQGFFEWILQYPVKFWEYCRVLDMLPCGPGQRVLDIGGGSSPISCYLAERGSRVYVVDNERVAGRYSILRNSNMIAAKHGWFLSASRGTATALPFADSVFERVISISVLEHVGNLEDQAAAFKEAHRVLKRGGMFAVTFDYGDVRKGKYHRCVKDSAAIRALISRAGFSVVGNTDFEDVDYDSRAVREWEEAAKSRNQERWAKRFLKRLAIPGYGRHLWYTAFSLFLKK